MGISRGFSRGNLKASREFSKVKLRKRTDGRGLLRRLTTLRRSNLAPSAWASPPPADADAGVDRLRFSVRFLAESPEAAPGRAAPRRPPPPAEPGVGAGGGARQSPDLSSESTCALNRAMKKSRFNTFSKWNSRESVSHNHHGMKIKVNTGRKAQLK